MGSAEQAPLPGMPSVPVTQEPKYYTLKPGTHVYTGPQGSETFHSVEPPLAQQATVVVLSEQRIHGAVSMYVKVTKPPELAGKSFWVVPRGGRQNGFR